MRKSALIAGVAAVALVAMPATAGASTSSVSSHVHSANRALHRVVYLVNHNQDAAAARAFARNRSQTAAAVRAAKSVRSLGSATRTANAYSLLAQQENANLETYASLVDEVSGRLQRLMAIAIDNGLVTREQALNLLTGLVDNLPEPARTIVSNLIASLSSDGQDETAAISNDVTSSDVSDKVKEYLASGLVMATQAIQTGLDRIEGLVDYLPADQQQDLKDAIEAAKTALSKVTDILQGIVDSSSSDSSNTSDCPTSTQSSTSQLPFGGAGFMSMFTQMFSSFLPHSSGDQCNTQQSPFGMWSQILGSFLPMGGQGGSGFQLPFAIPSFFGV